MPSSTSVTTPPTSNETRDDNNSRSSFFDLTPEIRILVYQNLTRTISVPEVGQPCVPNVRLQGYPLAPLLLVSKQFKFEYESELLTKAHCFFDVDSPQQLQPVNSAARAFFMNSLAHVRFATVLFPAWTASISHSVQSATHTNIERVRSDVRWLLGCLAGLRVLTVQCPYRLPAYQAEFQAGKVPTYLDTIVKRYIDSLGPRRGKTPRVRQEMLLHDDLYVLHPELNTWKEPSRAENWIRYYGRMISSPSSFEWCGLHLEMEAAGAFNEDDFETGLEWCNLHFEMETEGAFEEDDLESDLYEDDLESDLEWDNEDT